MVNLSGFMAMVFLWRGTRGTQLYKGGAFLWGDLALDQWSKITQIMVHQRNRWIHSGHGFIGSFDGSWSEWSWITDPDPNHPKGTHPYNEGHVTWLSIKYLIVHCSCLYLITWQSGVNCNITKHNIFYISSFILAYLGLKGISHSKSITRSSILNQQSHP